MATLVKFRKNVCTDEIIAVFPQLKYNKELYGNDAYTAYVHNGQHTVCNKDYVIGETDPALPNEYTGLKSELESIGYNLKVCK